MQAADNTNVPSGAQSSLAAAKGGSEWFLTCNLSAGKKKHIKQELALESFFCVDLQRANSSAI
jgi:formiminotetrahydrofolate cyclodeaminase